MDRAVPETVELADGSQIIIRQIGVEDAGALQRAYNSLSDRSKYRRFFQQVPALSDERAAYFTQLDQVNRHAVIAIDPAAPDELIGVARYDRRDASDRAEYAIVISDEWQNRGVGRALTMRLIRDALGNGVNAFDAYVLSENRPMLALFRTLHLPLKERRQADGVILVDIALRPAATPPQS